MFLRWPFIAISVRFTQGVALVLQRWFLTLVAMQWWPCISYGHCYDPSVANVTTEASIDAENRRHNISYRHSFLECFLASCDDRLNG